MSHTEEFAISGDKLVAKVKEIIAAGNVRRITIKSDEGKTLLEIPLTLGVVAAVIAPVLAALGALAALVTDCVIVVEREQPSDDPGPAI
jgi:integral membrane sensor domain MASE1